MSGMVGTELLIARHGLPGVDGTSDPGLSPEGKAQAEALGEWLLRLEPVAVVASGFRRAQETAAPIAGLLGVGVEIDDRWREWEPYRPQPHYVPPEQLRGDADDARRIAFREGRFEEFVPDHDSDGLRARLVAACRDLGERYPGQRVAVASHGGAINALVAAITETSRRFLFDPTYTGLTRVRVMPGGRLVLAAVNETGHLLVNALLPGPAGSNGGREVLDAPAATGE